MITQRDIGQMLTQFIQEQVKEQVKERLEPQQKQLAALIEQVQAKVEVKTPPARANGAARKGGWPKPKAKGKGGRRPGVPYAIPESEWASLAKRKAKGETYAALAEAYDTTSATIYNTLVRYEAAARKA